MQMDLNLHSQHVTASSELGVLAQMYNQGKEGGKSSLQPPVQTQHLLSATVLSLFLRLSCMGQHGSQGGSLVFWVKENISLLLSAHGDFREQN